MKKSSAETQSAREKLYNLLSDSCHLSGKKQTEAVLFGQRQVLEMLALGAPLNKVLESLIKVVESQTDGMLCAVMLVTEDEKHMVTGAAPSLHPDYIQAVDGGAIGPFAGSCGTAAFLRQPVFSVDISHDPLWEDFRDVAEQYNLRACWSTPILSSDSRLLGTFAMYYHEPRHPTEFEKQLIQDSTHLAAVAIEHAKTLDALKRTASLLNATLESTADGILVVDANGQVTSFNRKFAQLWLIPESILETEMENPVLSFLAAQVKDPEGFFLKLRQLQMQPQIESSGFLECKDGRIFEIYSLPQKIGEAIIGRVWNFRDVTERRKAELAATAANLAKAQFLANVSHEIRTPLAAVLGFSELLLNSDLTISERQDWGDKIKRNGSHLLKLIDEVLELSKAEFGRLDVELVEISLPRLVDDISSLFALRAREKGIDLKFVMDGDLPQVFKSDRTKLNQILINIIGNAIKFTDKGFVSVTIKFVEPSALSFTVEDSGVGLNPTQAAKLFQPFSQVDPSFTRRFGGTGLGLALARRLAIALGGDVVLLSSIPEVGSRFQITIDSGCDKTKLVGPLLSGLSELKVDSSSEEKPLCLQNVRVLLVEDSTDNRLLLSRFLTQAGAHVETATNGNEGVQKALANTYDVILMDIQMPEKDGYQAAREIRASGYRLPIVALTAHAMKQEQEQTKQAGCDDHVTKPVNRKTLVEIVRRFVERNARENALNLH